MIAINERVLLLVLPQKPCASRGSRTYGRDTSFFTPLRVLKKDPGARMAQFPEELGIEVQILPQLSLGDHAGSGEFGKTLGDVHMPPKKPVGNIRQVNGCKRYRRFIENKYAAQLEGLLCLSISRRYLGAI